MSLELGQLKFEFTGKVFCKETREGIEDLIVSLFDIDSSLLDQFRALQRAGNRQKDSVPLLTDRLGSTLTTATGEFELHYASFEFSPESESKKPDLLVVVQAPAEPDNGLGGFGALLYVSTLFQPYSYRNIGMDAARRESLSIAIPRATLTQHGIPVSGATNLTLPNPSSIRTTSSLFIERGLSSFTADQRSSSYYQEFGVPLDASMVKERDQTEAALIAQNIGNTALGVRLPESLSVDPDLDLSSLTKSIRRIVGDGDLIRKQDIVARCAKHTRLDKVVEALDEGDVDTAVAVANSTGAQTIPGINQRSDRTAVLEDLGDDLHSLVEMHLKTSRTPEMALSYGAYQKSQDQNAALNLRLKSGPADVTAFYDFDQLKFAYRHIWTEAFNEEYREIVERQFDTEVGVDTYSTTPNYQKYKTTMFLAGTVNFGLLLTHRQTWDPIDYQTGQIIREVTLTPGETQEYAYTANFEESRSEKRNSETQRTSKRSLDSSHSAIRDVVAKAKSDNSFAATASGGVSVGVFNGSASTNVGVNSAKESSASKKSVKERTKKALQESVNKINRELSIVSGLSTEATEKRKIENKNDEIAVTYLFYELQRRFRVSESLYRVRPVIFVADHVPGKDGITDGWIREHSWILRRVLLDDEYEAPLNAAILGNEAEKDTKKIWTETVDRHKAALRKLESEVDQQKEILKGTFDTLEKIAKGTYPFENDSSKDLAKDVIKAFAFGPFGGIGRRRRRKARQKKLEAIKDHLELEREEAEGEIDELQSELAEEESALSQASQELNAANAALKRRNKEILRVQEHIHQNILHYIRAIWDHEPPDQRLFRLQHIEVNWINDPEAGSSAGGVAVTDEGRVILSPPDPADLFQDPKPRLDEVAHIDQLLGCCGNYMIFPVREPNYLHLVMMQDYINMETGGAQDPDELSDMTIQEMIDYLACVREKDKTLYDQELERLQPELTAKLATQNPEDDILVIPTNSVFVQAMPDRANPVLEDFKLAHRALDVKKSQAEVRLAEIENIRRGGLIIADDLSDPTGDD